MAKFHVNNKGEAGLCSAIKGNCPFGSDESHFDTIQAARAHYEQVQIQVTVSKLTKTGPQRPSLKLRSIAAAGNASDRTTVAGVITAGRSYEELIASARARAGYHTAARTDKAHIQGASVKLASKPVALDALDVLRAKRKQGTPPTIPAAMLGASHPAAAGALQAKRASENSMLRGARALGVV